MNARERQRRFYAVASVGWYAVSVAAGSPDSWSLDWAAAKRFPRRWMAELVAGCCVQGEVCTFILDADDVPRQMLRDGVLPLGGRVLTSPFEPSLKID
jgi:hypothetical protein